MRQTASVEASADIVEGFLLLKEFHFDTRSWNPFSPTRVWGYVKLAVMNLLHVMPQMSFLLFLSNNVELCKWLGLSLSSTQSQFKQTFIRSFAWTAQLLPFKQWENTSKAQLWFPVKHSCLFLLMWCVNCSNKTWVTIITGPMFDNAYQHTDIELLWWEIFGVRFLISWILVKCYAPIYWFFYMSFWWNYFDIKQNTNIKQQVTYWDIKKLVIAMGFVCSGTKSQKAEITQNSWVLFQVRWL